MLPDDVLERVISYIKYQATKRDGLPGLVTKSQQRFLDAVGSVSEGVAAKAPPGEGEWCRRQLILHVIDAESSVATIIEKLARGEQPDAGRRGAGSMADDDGAPFSSYVERLRGVNQTLLGAIAALPTKPNLDATAPHPFFGQLNCLEWAAFQRVHDEDHVQHAAKILAAVSPP